MGEGLSFKKSVVPVSGAGLLLLPSQLLLLLVAAALRCGDGAGAGPPSRN
jgi:hypothetical protein